MVLHLQPHVLYILLYCINNNRFPMHFKKLLWFGTTIHFLSCSPANIKAVIISYLLSEVKNQPNILCFFTTIHLFLLILLSHISGKKSFFQHT